MSLQFGVRQVNAPRRMPPTSHLTPREFLAPIYSAMLQHQRVEIFGLRRQLSNPRNESRREQLVAQLDIVDARAADFYARMIEARGQQRIAT